MNYFQGITPQTPDWKQRLTLRAATYHEHLSIKLLQKNLPSENNPKRSQSLSTERTKKYLDFLLSRVELDHSPTPTELRNTDLIDTLNEIKRDENFGSIDISRAILAETIGRSKKVSLTKKAKRAYIAVNFVRRYKSKTAT